MKKLFVVALLAIAGATSAMAGSHTESIRIECLDGFVYEDEIEVDDNATEEQVQDYLDRLYLYFCW